MYAESNLRIPGGYLLMKVLFVLLSGDNRWHVRCDSILDAQDVYIKQYAHPVMGIAASAQYFLQFVFVIIL